MMHLTTLGASGTETLSKHFDGSHLHIEQHEANRHPPWVPR
jgi:hypothetical protein